MLKVCYIVVTSVKPYQDLNVWENKHCMFCISVCVVLTTVSSDDATQITSTSNRTMTPSTNLLFWAPHIPQFILHTHKHNTVGMRDTQTQNEQQWQSEGPYRAGHIRNGHACLCQPCSPRCSTKSTLQSHYMQSTQMMNTQELKVVVKIKNKKRLELK